LPTTEPTHPEIYDTLDYHLSRGADIAQAAVPMGLFLSWAVNLRLFAEANYLDQESTLLRIRFRETNGSELLVACGGDLCAEMFTAEGQRFVRAYYPRYLDDYAACFGSDIYSVEENWVNYDRLAAVLMRAYLGAPEASPIRRDWLTSSTQWLRKGWRRLWG